MTKRNRKQKDTKTKQATIVPEMKYRGNKKAAIITTLFALGGIYATFFVSILIRGGDAMENLLQTQSHLGGMYVNLFAVVSVAYSKFAKEIFVHRRIYWLSLLSFVLIISIFAQARIMNDPATSLKVNLLESPYFSIVLQILFAVIIYVISAQKEFSFRIKYNKKKSF